MIKKDAKAASTALCIAEGSASALTALWPLWCSPVLDEMNHA